MAGIRYKGQIFSGAASFGDADHVAYDNAESGLEATDVQGALDELDSKTSGIGQIVYSWFSTEVSVGTMATIVGSVNLSKGVWIAIGEIRYTKASSRLFCRLSLDNVISTVDEGVNSIPCTSPPLRLQSTRIITVSQNSATVNLIGYSDEASNTATGLIRAIRIV